MSTEIRNHPVYGYAFFVKRQLEEAPWIRSETFSKKKKTKKVQLSFIGLVAREEKCFVGEGLYRFIQYTAPVLIMS